MFETSVRPGPTAPPRGGGRAGPASVDSGAVSPQEEKSARRPRVFSGIQPSGTLHLGNYLGAIRNWVAMQETHDCVYCAVDLHAITVRQVRAELRRNTIDLVNLFLASGVDPERSIVFVQSHVSAHTELMWILNTITYMGELRRMTQFKDKTAGAEGESVGVGLFDYPVLMAADILLYRADAVPVGEDQKQHVELTRDVAERFNNAFGKTFVVPEPIIREGGARVMSLDDPTKKMSKSAGSENSYIAAHGRAGRHPQEDPARRHRLRHRGAAAARTSPRSPTCSTSTPSSTARPSRPIEARYEGKGYADFKADLAEVVVEALAPIQARIRELEADKSYTLEVLRTGAERAEAIAGRTLAKVRERVGLVPRP